MSMHKSFKALVDMCNKMLLSVLSCRCPYEAIYTDLLTLIHRLIQVLHDS